MFIDTSKSNNLIKSPFKSIAIPRPIAWISTIDEVGNCNLAPFSQFTNVTFTPPIVVLSINRDAQGNKKHTVKNIEKVGEFVHNMVPYTLLEKMNITASDFEYDIDEFDEANLTKEASVYVKPFRVKESPINLECKLLTAFEIKGNGYMGTADVIIGKVVAINIKDEYILPDGKVDVLKIKPLARLGYDEYTYVDKVFSVAPLETDDCYHKYGLEGLSY